jgi:hypothetical protein
LSDTSQQHHKTRSSVEEIIAKYRKRPPGESKLIGLSDATGSMASLWRATRKQILEMVTRISTMGQFQMQWVAYRDYCDGPGILESSGWQQSAESLHKFIDSIACKGGGDRPEAVERALEFAANDEVATRVFLIGDAPPHANRDYRRQAKRLAKLRRPVFTFVVGNDSETIRTFKEISDITGGLFSDLNDLDDLLDTVALVAADEMGSEDMITTYLARYSHQLSSASQKYAQRLLEPRKTSA